jgi:FXSXX-COOH protein
MIKAKGQTRAGHPAVLLGITAENVDLLVTGNPLVLDLADLGLPPTQVVLFYGRDAARSGRRDRSLHRAGHRRARPAGGRTMTTTAPDPAEPDIESELIDLGDIDWKAAVELAQVPDSPLAQALHRITEAAEDPDEAVSAFQQSI